jgi:hypothetical protein
VVLSVAVLIFLVGWAWRESAERKLADYSSSPVVREVVVRNAAGEVVGTATAAPRVPGMGAGTEFVVTLNQPLAAGEAVGIQMPRARRLNPQTGELEQISPQELRERLGRVGRMDRDNERGRDKEKDRTRDRDHSRERSDRPDHPFGAGGPPGSPADKSWFKPPFGFVWMLMLVGLAVALGTYPLIRRLTKRLNTLQTALSNGGRAICPPASKSVAKTKWRFWLSASTRLPAA